MKDIADHHGIGCILLCQFLFKKRRSEKVLFVRFNTVALQTILAIFLISDSLLAACDNG